MAKHDDKEAEASVRAETKTLRAEDTLIDSAIQALFASPDGRQFITWLLELTGINNQPFSPDPHVTAFNCGELNVGNRLLARFTEVTPEGYISLLNERNTNARRVPSTNRTSIDTSGDNRAVDYTSERNTSTSGGKD